MFSPNPKNDPLLSAIKGVIAENDKHREAVDKANKHFGVTNKKQLPHNLHPQYDKMISESNLNEKITKSTPMGDVIRDFEKSDAPQFEGKSKEKRRQMAIAAKMAMNEALKGDQHKIDANKNNRIDAQDFKMLRNKNMTAEEIMKEAISNISEKDELSEAENNILMELDVSDTEIMNSDLYKNAVKSLQGKDPKSIQIGQEVSGLGKFEKGDTIWSKVKSQLAAQKTAPPVQPTTPETTDVPPTSATQSGIGPGAKYSDLDKFKSAAQFKAAQTANEPKPFNTDEPASVGPGPNYPTADQFTPRPGSTPPGYSMVAGQTVRNDVSRNIPQQVTQPSAVRGYGSDNLAATIKSMFADRIRR